MRDLSVETSPSILRQAALLLERENRRLIAENLRLRRKVEQLQGKVPQELALELESLERQLALARQKLFGSSSEKLTPPASGDEVKPARPRRGHGPTPQPALPVLEEEHELPEEERLCTLCGGTLDQWPGQFEESEEVDVIERRFVLRRHKRKKYRCRCGGCVKTASAPQKLFPGARYSVDFAAGVAVSKYSDHLPLERQARIMAREGLFVTSQTLWDQLWALYEILKPLHDKIASHVLRSPLVFADETRWELLGKRGVNRKRWWVWGVAAKNAALYRILDSRSADAARQVLEGYGGTVVADGYNAYPALIKESPALTFPAGPGAPATGPPASYRLAHCWAHVRRKFFELLKFYPGPCGWMLERIGTLYEIEREVPRTETGNEKRALQLRRKLRAERSRAIAEEIREHALLWQKNAPKNLAQVLSYLLGLWPGLVVFLDDPRVPLDNNAAERALRGVVVGRKNHYGSKSKRGTEVAALFYSLVATCRLNEVDPRRYIESAARALLAGEADYPLPHEFASTS